MNDESLLRHVKKHDHQAFSILVHRHSRYFYNCAYRIVMNVQEAEDIVQDSFLKLWDKPTMWKEGRGAKFTSWFYKIVMNLSLDNLRKNKHTKPMENEYIYQSNEIGQFEKLNRTQEQISLDKALKELPEKQFMALNLCFYEEVKRKEAAEILGVSIKALESLLMRAKENVRNSLYRQDILPSKEGKTA